jgi:7-cyano-7-deazaguanine tRNA-ribosyltransferase
MEHPSLLQLRKLVGIGNYQFGQHVGEVLFNRKTEIECSRKTGRIRHVYSNGRLVATLKPKDGFLALSPLGASILLSRLPAPPNLVVVESSVRDEIMAGGDVFAKHVVRADGELRPGEEVIVVDEAKTLLGVGSAVLSGHEMGAFKRGVAVNLRRGVDEAAKLTTDAS